MNPGVVEEAERQLDYLEGPGQRLRTARLTHNVDLVTVANHLHLSPALLTALEQDEYHRLPDPVFVRGYIRNYARLFELPVEPLLDAYHAKLPPGDREPQLGRVRMKDSVGSGNLLARTVTWLIVAGLGVLLAMWVVNDGWRSSQPGSAVTSLPGSPAQREPEVQAQAGMPEIREDLESQGQVQPEPQIDAEPREGLDVVLSAPAEPELAEPLPVVEEESTVPSVPETDSAAWEEQASPQPAPVAGEVVLEVLGNCWVDIRDANGRNRIIGELQEGTRRILQGQPPYSIVLGNSRAVRMYVDGRPYDVRVHAHGDVARFKLDPTGANGT